MSNYDHVGPHSNHSHAQDNKESDCLVRRVLLSPLMSEKNPSGHWMQFNCKNEDCQCTALKCGMN